MMAGSYCRYCNHRCFVPRILPDGTRLHMATCSGGMAHDRAVTGYDHTTARNPHRGAERALTETELN
jgi:hypothetical protein